LAYRGSGNERYVQWADRYTGRWAAALLERQDLPLGIGTDGPVFAFLEHTERQYRSFMEQIPASFTDPVERAENLFAAGGVNSFLELYKLTRKECYAQAARKVLDILAGELQ